MFVDSKFTHRAPNSALLLGCPHILNLSDFKDVDTLDYEGLFATLSQIPIADSERNEQNEQRERKRNHIDDKQENESVELFRWFTYLLDAPDEERPAGFDDTVSFSEFKETDAAKAFLSFAHFNKRSKIDEDPDN